MKVAFLEKNLQELVAEEAKRRIGEQWPDLCGYFVREVLASKGVVVQGRLRDFGIMTKFEQMKPGAILLLYPNLIDYIGQIPFYAAILTGPDKLVGKKGSEIAERGIKFSIRYGLLYGSITLNADNDSLWGYVKIQRIPGGSV